MTATARRALLSDVRSVEVVEQPDPALGPGEVRLEVEACGICGSDLHMYLGHHPVLRPPLQMGHEFAGRVTEVGPGVSSVRPGERVVGMAGRGCGECAACLEGNYNWCERLEIIGGHRPGGLAERAVVPEEQLVRIPDWIPTEQAALIEVAAVGMHTARRYGDVAGRKVLVLGAGPIGVVLCKVLRALGAAWIGVSELSEPRRRLAAAAGADAVLNLGESDEEVRSVAPLGVDAAFDCAGRQETLVQALRLTRKGGSIVLTAIFPAECTIPMVELQRAERKLIGVQLYHRQDFEDVIALLESKRLDLSGVVTHELPLEEAAEGFRLLATPSSSAGKVLIRINPRRAG